MTSLAERARGAFHDAFDTMPMQVAVAPGRVNLIGEHTDYNDGFVLPMAIDRAVAVAFGVRADDVVRVHAPLFGETCTMQIAEVTARPQKWEAYVAGVVWALARAGHVIRGTDLAVVSDVPMGAGLSSSAALELAVARALCWSSAIAWEPLEMARLARVAEHEFVGVSCGIMDQFASALSVEGCALLLDCRTLEARPVRMPADAAVVVMDTGVRRSLTTSAYNDRREACHRALAAVQQIAPHVMALRDVSESHLSRVRDRIDHETYRRALHVVLEIERPPAMAARLEAGELSEAGRLMNNSHASLRDLYEVSCDELDAMVSAAEAHPACYGARLTGAGFGGCAIALVAASGVDVFISAVSTNYRRTTGKDPSLFVSTPSAGAHVVAYTSST